MFFSVLGFSSEAEAKIYTYDFTLAPQGETGFYHSIPFSIEEFDEITGTITASGTENNGDVSMGIMTPDEFQNYVDGHAYSYTMSKIYIFGEKDFEYFCRDDDINYLFVFKNSLSVSSSIHFTYNDHKFNMGENYPSVITTIVLAGFVVVSGIFSFINFSRWDRNILG